MEKTDTSIKLYYNTEVEKLKMPEYGRIVLMMVEQLKEIEDRDKRSQQARAVVKVMESLNPQVHQQENFEQKLWDHLFMIAGYDLDVDAPYPVPEEAASNTRPEKIPLNTRPIKARHYGRNIESIIDLVASEPEGDNKTALIRALAIYMRQQYLIWNKDTVADKTIFQDIERLSDGRVKVPEDLELSKISHDANFARPGLNLGFKGGNGARNRNRNRGGKKKY